MADEVTVALVAGVFTLIGVSITAYFTRGNNTEVITVNAELEIAKFREQWIQRLRDTLAEFQSYAMLPEATPHLERKFYELGTKIELLLNPDDPIGKADYEKLRSIMYKMLETSEGDVQQKYRNNPEFVAVSQRILKREWDRIKKELRFHYWKV